jgi:hypothetical protein
MKKLLLFILCPFFLFGQTQIGQDINGRNTGSNSGYSTSLSSNGSIIAIGANGGNYVRIYKINNGIWEQVGTDINGEAYGDEFGYSVSLSSDGSIVAVGAIGNDSNVVVNNGYDYSFGHVRIYKINNGIWEQVGADIDGEAIGDKFGSSVSLSSDGSIIAIGAVGNDNYNGDESGHVRIYKNNNGNWEQIGADINGEAIYNNSGSSVSLSSDGSIVAIGAIYNSNSNGEGSGHVRIYKNNNGNWEQVGADIDGEARGDYSGSSVSLSSDGLIVAIGATGNSSNNYLISGHVRIYKNNNGIWEQVGTDINGEATGDNSGRSVSLSSEGSIVAIGTPGNDNYNGEGSGHVRIYKNNNGNWEQVGVDINGERAGDSSGSSVSLSSEGSVVVIGSKRNNDNGNLSGQVRVYNLSKVLSKDNFNINNFNIYPNPASSNLTIQLENSILIRVNIYNTLSQLIKTKTSSLINIENLKSGIYYVEIITNKGKSSKKLIIN